MKHKLIIILLILACVFQFVLGQFKQVQYKEVVHVDTVYITPYPTDWELFKLALIDVESEYDTLAVNKSSKARGIFQIMPIFVEEANRLQDSIVFEWSDSFNVDSSLYMFDIVHRDMNIDNSIRRHNPNAGDWYKKRIYKRMNKFKLIFEVYEKVQVQR